MTNYNYCSEVRREFGRCYEEVGRYFPCVNLDIQCFEEDKESMMLLDFEPRYWEEGLEHPSSIYAVCKGEECNISGDLVVPHQRRLLSERLVRSIPNCSHTSTHTHAHSTHVHFECKSKLQELSDLVGVLARIASEARQY